MAQRSVNVVDAAGTVLAEFTADTDMGGIAVSFFGQWHSPALMARYVSEMQTLSQWLIDNGVA